MDFHRHVGYQIRAVSNLLKRKIDGPNAPDIDPVTEMQGHLLGYLYDHRDEDVFQRDLESAFCIRRSTVSRFLTALEKQGLLLRQPVPQDARLKKLLLTEKALAQHKWIARRIDLVEEVARQGISEQELDQFFETLQKIKRNLIGPLVTSGSTFPKLLASLQLAC